MHVTTIALDTSCEQEQHDEFVHLLAGYQFRLATSEKDWNAGFALRRNATADRIDERSWLLLAQEDHTGGIVGSLRVTSRSTGPLDDEARAPLPARLRQPSTIELARLAILPQHATDTALIPSVQLGLFRLCLDFAARIGARHAITRDRDDRAWLYDRLRFTRATIPTPSQRHALFVLDLTRALDDADAHPLGSFFRDLSFDEIVLPRRIPAPGPVSGAGSIPRACA